WMEGDYWGPSLFAVLGALATGFPLVVRPKRRTPRFEWALFVAAAFSNFLLVFAAFAWLTSNSYYGAVAGGLALVPLVLLFALSPPGCFPAAWDSLVVRPYRGLPPAERRACVLGIIQLAVVVLFLALVETQAFPADLLSPIPVLMLFLIGVVALYGVFLYLVRRAVFLVLGLFLLLGFAAHLQPYRLRFPEIGGYRPGELVRLRDLLGDPDGGDGGEVGRQRAFDRLLRNYAALDEELAGLKAKAEEKAALLAGG